MIEPEPTHQLVEMNIVTQPATEDFSGAAPAEGDSQVLAVRQLMIDFSAAPLSNTEIAPEPSTSLGLPAPLDVTDNAVMSTSRVGSPTSISNLLEMALGPQPDQQTIIPNKDSTEIPSFAGESPERSSLKVYYLFILRC